MLTILSILVFILVQGCAVCDELYPISVLRDITDDQLEGSSENNDDIELLQEKSIVQPNYDDIVDIEWIKTNIVKKYEFEKMPDRDEWEKQPIFSQANLRSPHFIRAAIRVKKFFKRNNDWANTKRKFRTQDSCINLLYITAARYLYVTHILHLKSRWKLIPCERTPNKKIKIPNSGVCYPAPPTGSATCTSDYDVSLVGKDAGFLIKKFNNYIQSDVYGFGKPSDLVFDTNVYAFTLAYAFPEKFEGLPNNFAADVGYRERTVNFKMQELASAYYKVFKYNPYFFNALKSGAERAMARVNAFRYQKKLKKWLKIFAVLNEWKVKMRIEDYNSSEEMRKAHNAMYQSLVEEMSKQGGYSANLLGKLAKAEIYAAEAYHTRGAIRHVVGGAQMNLDIPLSTNDLWVSMIENWGESNKVYNDCMYDPLEDCFSKMSKYLRRMFNAMSQIRERLRAFHRPGDFSRFSNLKYAWLNYKKQGKTAISKQVGNVTECLQQFQYDQAVKRKVVYGKPFPRACMLKINDEVNVYNKMLAGLGL